VAAKTNDGDGGGGGGPCANKLICKKVKIRKNNVEILVKIFIGDNPISFVFIATYLHFLFSSFIKNQFKKRF
jgi:hypothetical protein